MLAGALVAPPVAAATGEAPATPRWQGRPVAELLAVLQAAGLPLAFTSELVPADLEIVAEPLRSAPRARAAEVLAPHGLELRAGEGGLLVVVVAPAAVVGMVREHGSGRPIAGAEVSLAGGGGRTATVADGSYRLGEVAPGPSVLVAEAPGYLAQRSPEVTLRGEREVHFHLHPRPAVRETIDVHPSRLTMLAARPLASYDFSEAEIAALPHLGGDLFRALPVYPGVSANDVSASFHVRGGRRDEVRVLLDGQELYDAYHLHDFDRALSLVPSAALGTAELTTGALPASQGDRMSGVLDLRTREPSGGPQVRLGLGVFDATAAGWGSFASGRGGWLLAARRGSLDLAGRVVGDEDPRFWDVLGKLSRATARGATSLHLLVAGDVLDVVKREEEDFERLATDYDSTYLWARDQRAIGDRWLVETTASVARLRRERGGTGVEEDGGYLLADRRDLRVVGGEQRWSAAVGERHLWRWGGEARSYDAVFRYQKDLDLELEIAAPFAPPRATSVAIDRTVRGDHFGLWLSDRIDLGRRTTVELGARYDRHSDPQHDLVSPRASAVVRLGERSFLRAAHGRFTQSQRPYELQVEDGVGTLARPEVAEHIVVGWERLFAENGAGVESLRVEAYRRTVDDPRPRFENLLEPYNLFPEIEPDRVAIVPEASRAEGIELLVRGRAGARLAWWLAYTRSSTVDRIAGETVRRSFDQPDAVAFDVDLALPRAWHLNAAWRYHTGWPVTPVVATELPATPGGDEEDDDEDDDRDTVLAATYGDLNSGRLGPYHRLDLRLSRSWRRSAGSWTLYLDVQNLYDRENPAGIDASLDDEEGLVLEPESWPGIFPSLGVTWSWR